jgi:hypothetical protein
MNLSVSGSAFYDENPIQVGTSFSIQSLMMLILCRLHFLRLWPLLPSSLPVPKGRLVTTLQIAAKKTWKTFELPCSRHHLRPNFLQQVENLPRFFLKIYADNVFRSICVSKEYFKDRLFFLESADVSSPWCRTCNSMFSARAVLRSRCHQSHNRYCCLILYPERPIVQAFLLQ